MAKILLHPIMTSPERGRLTLLLSELNEAIRINDEVIEKLEALFDDQRRLRVNLQRDRASAASVGPPNDVQGLDQDTGA